MSEASTANASAGTPATPMTPLKGLLVLLGVIVVIGAFVALCISLGIRQFWAAFVFLLCWASHEHMAFDKLLACIVGAFSGLALAWSEQLLPGWLGDQGKLVFFSLILISVYAIIMGWVPVMVNFAFMLFLTIGTIPSSQQALDFPGAFAALGLGVVFFSALVWAGTRVMSMRATAQPQT